ncbi:MAG: nucleotidyl transferase AbiEii/AbiGii toxin family protein [Legionellaceae bacterium]|nr:nucleotidyl transferase AbiEii/AbiGii toxin family protein [Legionellaceae bacterium]
MDVAIEVLRDAWTQHKVTADELDYLTSVFKEICLVSADDGIVFDESSISAEPIKKEDGYKGTRIELFAELSRARIKIQIDIGFGDAVTPGPIDANYPVLLNDLPSPKIRTYPIYTVIAEKYHAIALLGMANSRLKDYFDLYVLLKNEELDEKILLGAIASTFARREMALPKDTPVGLTPEYSQDASRQTMWRSFLNKNEFESAPDSALFGQQTIAAVLRCSTQLLERNRWAGMGVPYLKIGRKVLYRKREVQEFLQQQRVYRS